MNTFMTGNALNSFSTRLAAARTRAAGNLSFAFRNQSGAFDLPSVLIGVAVVAILAIGVMATIFGIVPYAQDKAAQQNVSAIVTAQGTHYAQAADATSSYANLATLKTKGLLGSDVDATKVTVLGDVDQWVIATISASGKVYTATNDSPVPKLATQKTVPLALAAAVTASNTAATAAATADGTTHVPLVAP